MSISGVILLFKFQLLATSLVVANIDANIECNARDNNATGPDIEIYILRDIDSGMTFSCECMECSWYRLTVGDISQPIGNGSIFNWNQTHPGYGQFNCIRMNRIVAKKLLILPAGAGRPNCPKCLQTTNCINAMYFELDFISLFDRWILNGSFCELCRGSQCNQFDIDMCIEISKNELDFVADHYIRCPICNRGINMYYFIPVHTLSNESEVCNTTGNCSVLHQQSTVTTSASISSMIPSSSSTMQTAFKNLTTSKVMTSISSMMTSTMIRTSTMMIPITSTTAPSGTVTDDDDDNTGAIVGGIVATITIIIIIIIIIIIVFYCIKKKREGSSGLNIPNNDNGSNQTRHMNGNPDTPDIPNNQNGSNPTIHMNGNPDIPNNDNGSNPTRHMNGNPANNENGSNQARHINENPGIANNGNGSNQTTSMNENLGDHSNAITILLTFNSSRLLNAMKECKKTMEDHLNLEILKPFLIQYKIFSEDEIVDLNSTDNKGTSLIDILDTESETKIRNFMKALDDSCDHGNHLYILQDLHRNAIRKPVTSV